MIFLNEKTGNYALEIEGMSAEDLYEFGTAITEIVRYVVESEGGEQAKSLRLLLTVLRAIRPDEEAIQRAHPPNKDKKS